MEKTKMISLKEAVRKSWDLVTKNESIGYLFKINFVYFVAMSIIGVIVGAMVLVAVNKLNPMYFSKSGK